jgi:predicted Zn-dependent peptidase
VFLGCRLEIPVARVGKTLDEVLSEVRKLAKRGVTPDELERARAQLVAAAQSAQSDNGYWLEAVLADSQERPARLESARTLTTGYAGISKSEIDALAGRILAESNCLRFSFLPAAAVAKTP